MIINNIDDDTLRILQKRFKIIRHLGRGSFGNVYECIQHKNNEIYAVKIISKNNVKRSKIQCLREQATLLLSLDHENIVKVYEFFQDQNIIFIKMQCVNNGTLGQLMKQRQSTKTPFTDQQSSQIMFSIFNAVNYIHSKSILHRDIKPQNILVTDKNKLNKLKVADFGLGAKVQYRSPTATIKCGTYLYMAPEIMWNYTYTKAVDIWSCAIIMFMLKKGKHPFYQAKMTNDQFKQKIKYIKFPQLANKDIQNPQNNHSHNKSKQDNQNYHINRKKQFLAQDLITRISKLSPNQRYTALDCLKHPWITRNFEQDIPLSLHDSYNGFQISHDYSIMIKMAVLLKQLCYKKNNYEKIKKSQDYQKYIKKCEDFNKQDRCMSPLKVRRMSNFSSTRQIRQLCELSQLSISPKKQQKKQTKVNQDQNNPTIIKLNLIFNNLFDKKYRKSDNLLTLSQSNTLKSNANQNQQKLNYLSQKPDISAYKQQIQKQLEDIVNDRQKRKKKSILPERRKNQFGEYIAKGCQVRNVIKKQTIINRTIEKSKEKQKNMNNSLNLTVKEITLNKFIVTQHKARLKKKVSNLAYQNN